MPFKINSSLLGFKRPDPVPDFQHDLHGFCMSSAKLTLALKDWREPALRGVYNSVLQNLMVIRDNLPRASGLVPNPDMKPAVGLGLAKKARLEILQGPTDNIATIPGAEVEAAFHRVEQFKKNLIAETKVKTLDPIEAREVRDLFRGLQTAKERKAFVERAIADEAFGVLDAIEGGLVPPAKLGSFNKMRLDYVLKAFPITATIQADMQPWRTTPFRDPGLFLGWWASPSSGPCRKVFPRARTRRRRFPGRCRTPFSWRSPNTQYLLPGKKRRLIQGFPWSRDRSRLMIPRRS